MNSGITPIRPKVLFRRVSELYPNQNISFTVSIPSPLPGGLTLLESSVLISLCKIVRPRRLFEFGTYLGATTVLLAENTADDATVVTLDLASAISALPEDANLTAKALAEGAVCIDRSVARGKITQLHQDSKTLKGGLSGFDYVLIDGGHDRETVTIDTANARSMVAADAVIVWHDFASPIYDGVTDFLRNYSELSRIYHVEDTMLAFQLLGRHANALPDAQ